MRRQLLQSVKYLIAVFKWYPNFVLVLLQLSLN